MARLLKMLVIFLILPAIISAFLAISSEDYFDMDEYEENDRSEKSEEENYDTYEDEYYYYEYEETSSEVSATCQLPEIDNGGYTNCCEGDIVDLGMICNVSCKANYWPSPDAIKCIGDDTFDATPKCRGSCVAPSVASGFLLGTKHYTDCFRGKTVVPGTVCTLRCGKFTIKSTDNITCVDGDFDATAECTRDPDACTIPSLDNGRYIGTVSVPCFPGLSLEPGTSCTVDCEAGYTTSTPKITCNKGKFDATPKCTAEV